MIYILTISYPNKSRHKALDRLDADRKLLLFQHLGFITCPIREHCPAFPHCTDSLVERIVAAKKAAQGRPPSWSRTTDSNHLNLVVLGVEELASELADQIRVRLYRFNLQHKYGNPLPFAPVKMYVRFVVGHLPR